MAENKTKKYLYAIFLAIAVAAVGLVLYKFDFQILFFIRDRIRNPFLNVVVPFYTGLGDDGIIWIVVGVLMLIPKKTRKCGIMVLAALLVMLVTNNIILKNLIARARPYATYPELVADLADIIHIPKSYSFPSGHTVSAMATAFTIFSQHKKLGIAAIVAATLMGLSRLYVGVHFPTDVYGGVIVGALIALFVYWAEKKITPILVSKFKK
ncbi:MAG: phosphatase PAP2 family protein [Clostridia bacterium]|nr:phosphatase PAP2 family protein [Clostridia bacterium]